MKLSTEMQKMTTTMNAQVSSGNDNPTTTSLHEGNHQK